MDAKIYSQDGKSAGTIALSKEVFGLSWNADLVNQVVHSLRSSARDNTQHTKNRQEVRGGGKKPWQQKGTGRSRHGSSRSPIWVGGGVSHGPRNDRNFDRKINKTMKAKALYTILSQKMRDGEILFVKDLAMTETKTKEARKIVLSLSKVEGYETLATKRNNAAYIALDSNDVAVRKSFNNFNNMTVEEFRNVNILDLLKYKFLIVSNPEKSLSALNPAKK